MMKIQILSISEEFTTNFMDGTCGKKYYFSKYLFLVEEHLISFESNQISFSMYVFVYVFL